MMATKGSPRLVAKILEVGLAFRSDEYAELPRTRKASPNTLNHEPSVTPISLFAVSSIRDPRPTDAAPSARTLFPKVVYSTSLPRLV